MLHVWFKSYSSFRSKIGRATDFWVGLRQLQFLKNRCFDLDILLDLYSSMSSVNFHRNTYFSSIYRIARKCDQKIAYIMVPTLYLQAENPIYALYHVKLSKINSLCCTCTLRGPCGIDFTNNDWLSYRNSPILTSYLTSEASTYYVSRASRYHNGWL